VTAAAGRGPRAPALIEERTFHAWLRRALRAAMAGPLPLGDDAAAVGIPPGAVAVVSTDTLVEGTHFLAASPPRRVGRAATAVSLSDVAAKGAEPVAVFLAVVVPRQTRRSWAQQLVRGAEAEAARYGAHVLGGDLKPGRLRTVTSTVVGTAPRRGLVGRSGARAGDVLLTTGEVGRGGAAALGLRAGSQRRTEAVTGLLSVRPRVREGIALARYAHAVLDTSDGLAESARLLARASRVRLLLDEERLPLARALARLRSPARRRAAAFYGGDYELLAAVPPDRTEAATRAVRKAGGRLTPIGSVARGGGAFLRTPLGLRPMPPSGWQPFRQRARSPAGRAGRGVPRSGRPHGTVK